MLFTEREFENSCKYTSSPDAREEVRARCTLSMQHFPHVMTHRPSPSPPSPLVSPLSLFCHLPASGSSCTDARALRKLLPQRNQHNPLSQPRTQVMTYPSAFPASYPSTDSSATSPSPPSSTPPHPPISAPSPPYSAPSSSPAALYACSISSAASSSP